LSLVACENKSGIRAPALSQRSELRSRFAARLDRAIFICLCVVAYSAPQFIRLATFAFEAAFLLWAVKLIVLGREYEKQPFLLPSILFLVTAGIASGLSYVPLMSWERMSSFVLLPIAVVVAQNVKNLRQVKILVTIVLLSAMVSALRTGWQYVYGIGTELVDVPAQSVLFQDGVRSGDLIQMVNGHKTRSLRQWRDTLQAIRPDPKLRLHIMRNSPVGSIMTYLDVTIEHRDLQEWLNSPSGSLKQGRPLRAQGHLDHYVRYAGVMMQLALLAFGLLIATPRRSRLRFLLAVTVIALAAALFATLTRAYLFGFLFGCAFIFWLTHRRFRTAAVIGLVLALLGAAAWIRQERGPVWLSLGDEFRFEMWRDSLRIIPHHPLFGVGLDSVNQYAEQWNIEAFKKFDYRAHFHSTYVQLAVDCGLPCLAAWIWLLAGYLLFLWRSWRRSQTWDGISRGILLGIFASALIFVMASTVHYTLADSEVVVVAWLFMGLAIALVRIQEPDRAATFTGSRF
jgi:hypothetical protein